jgi:hypothetical protein
LGENAETGKVFLRLLWLSLLLLFILSFPLRLFKQENSQLQGLGFVIRSVPS